MLNFKKIRLLVYERLNKMIEIFNRPEKELLLCGGAVGHLQHLYDNVDLTFAEIKDVIIGASEGKLEKSSEKLDGMNLVFSFDVRTNSLRAARTGTDIKGGGMDASGLAKKFFGRGNVEAAFNDSFKVLNDALSSLGPKEKIAAFGKNANRWYSIEIIYTANPNTINYDSNNVVFHGWPIFEVQSDGSVSQTSDDTGINILSKNIDRMQAAVSSKDWRVRGPSLLSLKKISDGSIVQKAISDIDAAMNSAGVSDSDTILDYMRSMMSEKVAALGLPEEIAEMTTERAIEAPGAPSVTDIKRVAGLEYSRIVAQFVKSAEATRKAIIEPIEMAIHRFAIEVLRGLNSTLIASSDEEVQRLRSQVTKAITAIQASGNQDAMAILHKEMKRLGSVENIAAAMEGMVFFFKGKAYKFTGVFSPVNQILGLFKYGRGSTIPAMDIGESKSFREHTTTQTHGKYLMSNAQTTKLLKEVVKLMVEGSGGASYEESVLAAIASCGASGKIVTVTGSDATLPDADITINGKIYNVEVKMNGNAQMGGGSVGWNQSEGFFATGKDHVKEEVQPIADMMNSEEGAPVVKAIKRFIKFLNANNEGIGKKITGFPMSGFLVSAWDEAVAQGLLVPLNVKIEDDIEFVFRHYAKKNVHYIQIGGKGLFYMSSNPANLPVPQLSGRNILEFRASRSGSGGKPTGAGGAFRVQARLKIDNTSPYTLDDPDSIAELLNVVGRKKRASSKRLTSGLP